MEKVIAERKKNFWGDPRFNDVSFSFEDSNDILQANKMILTLCSPVFEAMFFGDFEKQDPVVITDISYDVFNEFLFYIYTDNFKISSLDEAKQLFYVANKYEVVSLEAACERYIIKNIGNFNVEEVLKFAEMFSLKNLEWLSRLLKNHSPNVVLSAQWVSHKKGDAYPKSMVFAGFDAEGFPIGVGRFDVGKDLIPGTLNLKEGFVEVCYAGRSYKNYEKFQILCDGSVVWVESKNGIIQPQSVPAGKSDNHFHEPLFTAKIEYKGKLVVGKVHPSHHCLYIPWNDAELKIDDKYFHLVDKNIPKRTERQQLPYYDDFPGN